MTSRTAIQVMNSVAASKHAANIINFIMMYVSYFLMKHEGHLAGDQKHRLICSTAFVIQLFSSFVSPEL